jgi:hypothetical protein
MPTRFAMVNLNYFLKHMTNLGHGRLENRAKFKRGTYVDT